MIRVENLTKYYGKRLAVDNISFNIDKGEIVGLLGPNGAGKTTTMRILTGFLMPTNGECWIAGHNVINDSLESRKHIGYLPEQVPLYTDMTVRSYLDYLARLRNYPKNKVSNRVDDVIDICQLQEYADVFISKLSKGFRQRVGVGQAIVHEPDVLILDEPTVGIDPIQVTQTRKLIKELGKDHTVILSSHILPEVSTICKRVIIINEGNIVAEDNIDNLSSLIAGTNRLRMEIKGVSSDILEMLKHIRGVSKAVFYDTYYIVEYPANVDLRSQISETVTKSGYTLLSMQTETLSLEDIFLRLTKEQESKN